MCNAIKILALFALISIASASVGCRNNDGNPVDWFIALKMPVDSDSPDPHVQEGMGFAYLDADNTKLKMIDATLKDANHAIGYTLQQTYDNAGSTNSYGYLMWDDQTPDGAKHESRGHCKGNTGFDHDQGFWLIHSVPRFPPFVNSGYEFPENEAKYGQSFMCITVDRRDIDSIVAPYLLMAGPALYDHNLPSGWDMPQFQQVLNEDYWTKEAAANTTTLRSVGGQTFHVLSKNKEWGQDLYEGLVCPTINQNVLAETWMNGWNPLPTYCTPQYSYDAINIRTLSIPNPSYGGSVDWKETQDHSKWCISVSSGYTCIGDINRQNGQLGRGGGTVCLYVRLSLYTPRSLLLSFVEMSTFSGDIDSLFATVVIMIIIDLLQHGYIHLFPCVLLTFSGFWCSSKFQQFGGYSG